VTHFDATDAAEVAGAFDRGAPTRFDVADLETLDRSHFGRVVIWGYLLLIALVVVLPLIVWAVLSGGGAEFDKGLRDVQELTVAMIAGLSGVAGLAGLVMGRYFNDRSSSTVRSGKNQPGRKKAGNKALREKS
jgi:L-cystine uptake protein TcyP (sodium:dicarboxylate symporter family)